MSREKPQTVKLHELQVGQPATDFYALLIEKNHHTTQSGKGFFNCKFRNKFRTVSCPIWSDSGFYAACESDWQLNTIYKIRGLYVEHERYGAQIDIKQIRATTEEDHAQGLALNEFYDCSRFNPDDVFGQLCELIASEITSDSVKALVIDLLTEHAITIKLLPATKHRFYPYPGGWLEHTWNVTRNVIWLGDQYRDRFPELHPPLDRDLLIAGAALHEIGRLLALTSGPLGHLTDDTIPGQLTGHMILGRDLIRTAAQKYPELKPEFVELLGHIVLTHLTLPEWGSPRLPMIPEVLILHHADDLDAKFEMYARHLGRDQADGPFTDPDPVLKKRLLKVREWQLPAPPIDTPDPEK